MFTIAGGLFLNHCVVALVLRQYPTTPTDHTQPTPDHTRSTAISSFEDDGAESDGSGKPALPPPPPPLPPSLPKKRFDLTIFRNPAYRLLPIYSMIHFGAMNGFLGLHPSVADSLSLDATQKSYLLVCLGQCLSPFSSQSRPHAEILSACLSRFV